ncbi:hypothetical protein MGSAQ_002126 [marine sediment metagenome]|uniref:Uncharacterized protein n=1 Tax=marine sediment metagenome TaxID=412755 RepID=A0A1B6NSR0_9ZZZZ
MVAEIQVTEAVTAKTKRQHLRDLLVQGLHQSLSRFTLT